LTEEGMRPPESALKQHRVRSKDHRNTMEMGGVRTPLDTFLSHVSIDDSVGLWKAK
jgi:hypothetical protein